MKQKTLGQVAHDASVDEMPWENQPAFCRADYETIARAVVREHEKRKGLCVCDKDVQAWANWVALPDWSYCPKCGKRIKVGK